MFISTIFKIMPSLSNASLFNFIFLSQGGVTIDHLLIPSVNSHFFAFVYG